MIIELKRRIERLEKEVERLEEELDGYVELFLKDIKEIQKKTGLLKGDEDEEANSDPDDSNK